MKLTRYSENPRHKAQTLTNQGFIPLPAVLTAIEIGKNLKTGKPIVFCSMPYDVRIGFKAPKVLNAKGNKQFVTSTGKGLVLYEKRP